MLRRPVSWLTSAALLFATTAMPLQAQQMVPKGAPSMQPVQDAPQGAPEQPQAAVYSPEQLDAILAPIALYPDVLLTQVLMASGFPLQVIEASRWVQANRGVTGQALERALVNRNWDPSVKSLVPFPAVLAQMTGNLEWLQDLGSCALQQQPDVLDSIQRLRQRAETAGNLRTTPQQIVRTEERYIYIEPAQPELVYVPAYNPVETYGVWAYPAYPPVYLPPAPGYGWGNVVGPVLLFGAGVVVVAAFWNLGRPRWHDRNIWVDSNRYNHINVNRPNWRGGNVWHPANTNTFYRAGLGNPPGPAGGPGRGPGWNNNQGHWQGNRGPGQGPGQGRGEWQGQHGGAGQNWRGGNPGGQGQGGSGAPGHQFRDRGAPGTVGNSGITPPGNQGGTQYRGHQGGGNQSGIPGGGGGGNPYRGRGGDGGGNPAAVQGGGGGGGAQFRGHGGGGGGNPAAVQGGGGGGGAQFRGHGGGGGGNPAAVQGGGGGGGAQFRGHGGGGGGNPAAVQGGGGGGGGHGGGGGQQFRSQPSGGGGGGGGGGHGGGGGGNNNQRRQNQN